MRLKSVMKNYYFKPRIKIAEEKLRWKYEELKESQRILKASEEKIRHLASYDSFTGLLNRRSLLETNKIT